MAEDNGATSGVATTRSSGATGQYVARFEIRMSSRIFRDPGIRDPFGPKSRGHGNSFTERVASGGHGATVRDKPQYIQAAPAWHGRCFHFGKQYRADSATSASGEERSMNNIFYIIGVVVVVLVVSLFFTLELLNFMAGARLASIRPSRSPKANQLCL